MRALVTAATLILVVFAPLAAANAAPSHLSLHQRPSVRLVSPNGYEFGVSGHRWPRNHVIVVTIACDMLTNGPYYPWPVQGVELRTAHDGSFLIGVTKPSVFALCSSTRVGVRDFGGHRASAASPPVTPSLGKLPAPTASRIVIVKGVSLHPHVTILAASPPTHEVTVRRGDALYLNIPEPEKSFGMILPRTDDSYLDLFADGAYNACSRPSTCGLVSEAYHYEWIAMKPGVTAITIGYCRPGTHCPYPSITVHIHR